jgi:hypothetical protein
LCILPQRYKEQQEAQSMLRKVTLSTFQHSKYIVMYIHRSPYFNISEHIPENEDELLQ